jgi:hypothetical protein
VEDVARMERGRPILLPVRRPLPSGRERGHCDRGGQDRRAVDTAGAAGRRAAFRGVPPEAIRARASDSRQGQQKRQDGKQDGGADPRRAHHAAGILHRSGADSRVGASDAIRDVAGRTRGADGSPRSVPLPPRGAREPRGRFHRRTRGLQRRTQRASPAHHGASGLTRGAGLLTHGAGVRTRGASVRMLGRVLHTAGRTAGPSACAICPVGHTACPAGPALQFTVQQQ